MIRIRDLALITGYAAFGGLLGTALRYWIFGAHHWRWF